MKCWILLQIIGVGLVAKFRNNELVILKCVTRIAELLEALEIVDRAMAKDIAIGCIAAMDERCSPGLWTMMTWAEEGFLREAAIARERIRAVSIG